VTIEFLRPTGNNGSACVTAQSDRPTRAEHDNQQLANFVVELDTVGPSHSRHHADDAADRAGN
jgi:hypothetical protein